MSTPRFDGRLVLVTGAASGIGRATAFAFAAAGARVVAVDIDGAGAGRTAELASLLGPPAHAAVADVGDESAMEALAEAVEAAHGRVDVVVNNAGVGIAGPFLETTADDWHRTLDVNLWGVIHGCRIFGRRMVARGSGGTLVNVSSLAGFQPSRSLSAYCTSKAAVLMLSECLRAELGPHGIGVTAVCPGVVSTNITRHARFTGYSAEAEASLRDGMSGCYQLRGFGPDQVAAAILRAVHDNADVVAVTPEAQLLHFFARFAPFALRALAGVELLAPREDAP